jgi:uridine phosphorylase
MMDFTRAVPLEIEERYISPESVFRASFGPDVNYDDYALPETAVIGLTNRLIKWTRESIGTEPVRSFTWSSVDYSAYEIDGKRIAVVGPVYFGPRAAIVLETLQFFGVKRVICVSCGGAISPDLSPGDIVVGDSALREDGTSAHYVGGGNVVDGSVDVCNALDTRLRSLTGKSTRGMLWTTDASYRETISKVKRYSDAGLLMVEMELAAVYAVAASCGLEAGWIGVVSDCLHKECWQSHFHGDTFRTNCLTAIQVAIDCAVGR